MVAGLSSSSQSHSSMNSSYYGDKAWHIFKSDHRSSPIYEPYISPFAESIRQAWNLPSMDVLSPAYRELEFDRAMDIIYRHQHPQDCMKAKYLISEGYSSGFGSEIHVDGYFLHVYVLTAENDNAITLAWD